MRDAPGFFERTAGRKNEPFVGHIKSVVSRSYQVGRIKSKIHVSLEAYEAADGNANQVWQVWMGGGDGRRVHWATYLPKLVPSIRCARTSA
jgi:hypothetical protein